MKAAIDIGTNTILLLVADIFNGRVEIFHEEQHIPRLGKEVDESGFLTEKAMLRSVEVLRKYQELLAQKYPAVDAVYVTATSAVRDAKNRENFLEMVKAETGLDIRILNGDEEALLTFWGAKNMISNQHEGESVIIDIGGGSTEIALGNTNIRDRYSFDMGCVRYSERYLKQDPPSKLQIDTCRKAVQGELEKHFFEPDRNAGLIGVAGTVTSLAYIDQNPESYDSGKLNGHVLSFGTISDYVSRFQQWPSQKLLEEYPEVMKGRADIFFAGLLILEGFMRRYEFEQITTSTGGIRHGALINLEWE